MRDDLLELVQDIPRHVEARSALLGGRAEIFGGGPSGLVLLDRAARLVSVIGDVPPDAVGEAASLLEGSGAVIGDPALDLDWPGWAREMATLYQLEGLPRVEPFGSRLVSMDEILRYPLPEYLLVDLTRVHTYAPIAATFLDNTPVSFCYAVETESQWDVSIDTLPQYRGRGYAGACVSWMIGHEATCGRRPVWGAVDSNTASRRVAAKLGFVPVDRIAVWEPVPAS
jgi:GNAT superfamily N-acetyltransferase